MSRYSFRKIFTEQVAGHGSQHMSPYKNNLTATAGSIIALGKVKNKLKGVKQPKRI